MNYKLDIDSNHWVGILEQATKSRKSSAIGQGHLYIAANKTSLVIDLSNRKSSKLPLEEIIRISNDTIEKLKNSFEEGVISANDAISLKDKIVKFTENLIDGRQAKRDRWPFKLARTIAYLAGFLFPFIPGMDFRKKLDKHEANFKQEIRDLKQSIHPKAQEAIDRWKQIEQINRIPSLLAGLSISDEQRLELIQKIINQNFENKTKTGNITQFENDITRGVSFLRKDTHQNIEDLNPLGKDIEQAANALQELFINEDEKNQWESAIQSGVCNQTALNIVFDPPITVFSLDASNHLWTEEGQQCVLKAVFAGALPPIHLEVIRNSTTHEIEKVNVEVKAALNIVSFSTTEGEIKNIVLEKAIEGNLKYTMTLDKKGYPCIRDLQSKLKAGPSLPSVVSQR